MTKFYSTDTRDAIGAHLASLPPKVADRHSMKEMVAHWSDHIARALTLGYSLSDVHAELLKHEEDLCKFETFASYWRGLARTAEEQQKTARTTKAGTNRRATSHPAPGTGPVASRTSAAASHGQAAPAAAPAPTSVPTPALAHSGSVPASLSVAGNPTAGTPAGTPAAMSTATSTPTGIREGSPPHGPGSNHETR